MPKINFNEAEVVDVYIGRLVADRGLAAADREENGKIAHELKQTFEEACQKAIIGALPEEKIHELTNLLDAGEVSDAQIEQVFDTSGVDYAKVIQDTMVRFRAEYLGLTGVEAQVTGIEEDVEMPVRAESTNSANQADPTVQANSDASASAALNVAPAVQNSPAASVPVSPIVSMPAAPDAVQVAQPGQQATQTFSATPVTPAMPVASPAPVIQNNPMPIAQSGMADPATNMTNNLTNQAPVPPAGNPVQGTTSDVPGASNVEGVAQNMTAMTEENR